MSRERQKRLTNPGHPKIKLHTLGAAGDVTGSLNLFEFFDGSKVTRFILDVGLDQADENVNHARRLPKGIKASMIDFVVFSHAHVDHSAWYPVLIADGFEGDGYTHPASKALMRRLLADSGKLQTMAAERTNFAIRAEAEKEGLSEEEIAARLVKPLYTAEEGVACLDRVRTIQYNQPVELAPGITVVLRDAGHILGSATVTVTFRSQTSNWKRVVCFTGNVGRPNQDILGDLKPVHYADYIISESTYGDMLHEKRDRLAVLEGIINSAYKRALKPSGKDGRGVIVIPAFSVGRVQAVLFDLRVLMEQGRIPTIPVFLDSPLAIAVTEIYARHSYAFNARVRAMIKAGIDPITPPVFAACRGFKESKALDRPASQPVIVIGSSGMAAGGSIRRHVERKLSGEENTILFVGHQEPGNLGHTLVSEDQETVSIGNKDVPVKATIEYMPDYSAHADYQEIIDWMKQFKRKPSRVFLVHGEPKSLTHFQGEIRRQLGWRVTIPQRRQVFDLV